MHQVTKFQQNYQCCAGKKWVSKKIKKNWHLQIQAYILQGIVSQNSFFLYIPLDKECTTILLLNIGAIFIYQAILFSDYSSWDMQYPLPHNYQSFEYCYLHITNLLTAVSTIELINPPIWLHPPTHLFTC